MSINVRRGVPATQTQTTIVCLPIENLTKQIVTELVWLVCVCVKCLSLYVLFLGKLTAIRIVYNRLYRTMAEQSMTDYPPLHHRTLDALPQYLRSEWVSDRMWVYVNGKYVYANMFEQMEIYITDFICNCWYYHHHHHSTINKILANTP